jgi:predicted transcriptional regulator
MWEPCMGTPTGYPFRYRSNNSINIITVVTNNRNRTGIVTSVSILGSLQDNNRNIRRRRFSQLDVYDRLARTFQQCSSRGAFCEP